MTAMPHSELQQQIDAALGRATALQQTSGLEGTHQNGLLPELFEELHISLEELRVTEEELRQQNDFLSEAQVVLADERRRYQELFDFAPDAYLVTDALGTVREANRAAGRLLGITPRRLVGKPLAAYVALADRAAFRSALAQFGDHPAQHEWALELTVAPRQRSTLPAALTIGAMRDAAGNVTSVRWLVRDVSERREWEDRLREANRDLEQRVRERTAELEAARAHAADILESITDCFYAVDSAFRLTYVNREAERWLGRDRETLIGRVFWEEFPQAVGSETHRRHLEAMADRSVVHFEALSAITGRWAEVHTYPTAGGGLSVYFRDISERKRAEQAKLAESARTRRVADTLQTALMQTVSENAFPGLSLATLYKAASEEALVGGDFYDAFPVDGGEVALVVGDVSGKGLSAAAHIAEVKYALRAFLHDAPRPAHALARLNDFICEMQRQDDWGNASLVVLALAIVTPETGHIAYASAGAEPLLAFPPGELPAAEHGRGSGLVLGVMPGREYLETTLTLPPGGLLLMATDGITEARQGGEMLGLDGLKRLASEARPLGSVGEISRAILEGATAYAGGLLTDDACLLLARRATERRPGDAPGGTYGAVDTV